MYTCINKAYIYIYIYIYIIYICVCVCVCVYIMIKYRTMDDMLLKPSPQSTISIPSLHDIFILHCQGNGGFNEIYHSCFFEDIFFLLY